MISTPRKNVDALLTLEVLSQPCHVWACVILLKHHMITLTSQQRNELRSQDFTNITSDSQITMDYKQTRAKTVADGAPNHDATATKPVKFHNAVVGITFSVASIHLPSSIYMEQIEPRFITEGYVMPVDSSLVVLSKIIANLSMTSLSAPVHDKADGSEYRMP